MDDHVMSFPHARSAAQFLLCGLLASCNSGAACSRQPDEAKSQHAPRETSRKLDTPVSWPSGTDGLDPTYRQRFSSWRGRPATSSWINVHYLKWEWLTAPGFLSTLDGQTPVSLWDVTRSWPGLTVLSMSLAGADSLPQGDYDQALHACAEGEFDDEWRAFASNAKERGRTGQDTVVSPAHEFNGTWFRWNPGNVGVDVWKSCWRHVYRAIKSTSDLQVTWVFSATDHRGKGGDYAVDNAWDAYPGDDYVDIIGINRYDFRMLGSRSSTDWRETCGNPQDLCNAAEYARAHHKRLAVPEWSVDRGKYGYGDNPQFIEMMYRFFVDNADILAFENNFNNAGQGEWHLFPVQGHNKQAAARYRELWRQR